MPAEVYADDPGQLDLMLRYLPDDQVLPTVHLNRAIDLLDGVGRATVLSFRSRFAGRVAGLVVHDHAAMARHLPEVAAVLAQFAEHAAGRPAVLLEYAAGLEHDFYLALAERLSGATGAGLCLDIGHVGVRAARADLTARVSQPDQALPGLDDPGLPGLVPEVEAATAAGRTAVLALLAGLAERGVRLHLHLHDAHPLHRGLADHFSFLARVPVPFPTGPGAQLSPMFGPTGLAQVLRAAVTAVSPAMLSATLEIHQVEGRLPVPGRDAREIFGHWSRLANAERTNYWLSVLADNHALATLALRHCLPG
jgi:hypothetical protein